MSKRKDMAPKRKVMAGGRREHVRYSARTVEKILLRVAQGHTLQAICSTERMPCYKTFCNWRKVHADLNGRLETARVLAADWQADEALRIAAETTKDTLPLDKLRVATLMKHAALRSPARWGGKADGAAADVRIAIRIREFVSVTRPDGKVVTREVFPDGSQQDYER